MDDVEVAASLRETRGIVLMLGGPLLGAALVVGLVVALIQAVTQINEATLAFLPKVLVLGGMLALLGPFMASSLADYTHVLMDRLITVGGQ